MSLSTVIQACMHVHNRGCSFTDINVFKCVLPLKDAAIAFAPEFPISLSPNSIVWSGVLAANTSAKALTPMSLITLVPKSRAKSLSLCTNASAIAAAPSAPSAFAPRYNDRNPGDGSAPNTFASAVAPVYLISLYSSDNVSNCGGGAPSSFPLPAMAISATACWI